MTTCFLLLTLFTSGAIVILFFSIGYFTDYTTNNSETTVIDISKGSTAQSLAIQLENSRIISHPFSFRARLMIKGLDKRINHGEFQVNAHMEIKDLIRNITHARNLQHPFTIIPGERWDLIRHKILKTTMKPLTEGESRKLQGQAVSLEGLFSPNTYYYTKGQPVYEILKIAKLKQMDVLYSVWHNRASNLLYTSPTSILVVASLLEKETHDIKELYKISRVIHNRLNARMLLQIDAAAIYANIRQNKLNSEKGLTTKHIQTVDPYNTYRYLGLPPGPICMVSEQAIHAAAHPEEGSWYYYRTVDGKQHVFSNRFTEHLKVGSK